MLTGRKDTLHKSLETTSVAAGPDVIDGFGYTVTRRTVCTAVNFIALRLDAVPDDSGLANRANGRECLDRAFEAIERLGVAVHPDVERAVVVVTAIITSRHHFSPGAVVGVLLNEFELQKPYHGPDPARS
jgi:hypothetical protein